MRKSYETLRLKIVESIRDDILTESTQTDPFGKNNNPSWVGGESHEK